MNMKWSRLARPKIRTVLLALLLVVLISAACTPGDVQKLFSYPFEYVGNPGIPPLQTIVAGATTDQEALDMIVAYYDDHLQQISQILGETNPVRLKALYAMFVTHISHDYGVRTAPSSLLDYLAHPNSHCGMYSRFQAQISDAMGLTWRIFTHDIAQHAWVEVKVDGQWEIFDSTVNVWISTDGYSLIEGKPRQWRAFYTPMNDITRLDARMHLLDGWNMPRLRLWMPQLGLTYNPPAPPSEIAVIASSVGEGSDYNTPWYVWFDTQRQVASSAGS